VPDQSVRWQTEKLSKRKSLKELLVTYSGALNTGDAQDLAAYHLVTPGKNKQFGSKGARTVKLTSAAYNAGVDAVTLTTSGTVPNPPLQLQINPALVLDAEGRPISGAVALTLGKGGITISIVAQPRDAREVSAEALDALVLLDELPPTRGRWIAS
jgi:hypothetical protein